MRITPEKAVCQFCGQIIQEVLEIRHNKIDTSELRYYYYWRHYDIDRRTYLNTCPSGKKYNFVKPEYGAYI